MAAALDRLRIDGHSVQETDLSHLSPCRYEHINPYGKYAFGRRSRPNLAFSARCWLLFDDELNIRQVPPVPCPCDQSGRTRNGTGACPLPVGCCEEGLRDIVQASLLRHREAEAPREVRRLAALHRRTTRT